MYVDFVEDAGLLAMKLTEDHGIQTGRYSSNFVYNVSLYKLSH